MASMNRPKSATYVINEKVTIDTTDREDHTFCGIAFPVQCKIILPVDHIVINSISVRGALGQLSLYITKEDSPPTEEIPSSPSRNRNPTQYVHYNLRQRGNGSTVKQGKIIMRDEYWDKIYEKKHGSSFRDYKELDLSSNPIVLHPGEIRGIYIHSTLESDQAIVYDNQSNIKTHDDPFITVLPGRAHVSTCAFGTMPIWGWGNAWRDNREFVGKISYGVVYKLWNPSENLSFGDDFRKIAEILFMCQRRWESPISMLSDDCIFYILNMCRWDWMGDSVRSMRDHRRRINALGDSDAEAAAVGTQDGAEEEEDEDYEETKGDGDDDDDDDDDDDEDEEFIDNDGVASDVLAVASSGGLERMEIGVDMADEYDSDYADSDDGSEDDDGYDDHRGSSTFTYFYYDDCGSSDEEEATTLHRERQERRRLLWLRNHFIHHLAGTGRGSEEVEDDDSE